MRDVGVGELSILTCKRQWELPGKMMSRRKGLMPHPTHPHPQFPLDMVLWGIPTPTLPGTQPTPPVALSDLSIWPGQNPQGLTRTAWLGYE